jgi:hypothetical protein
MGLTMRISVDAVFHLKRPISFTGLRTPGVCIAVAGALIVLSNANASRAQDGFYDVETKYIFGFTEGSGVGLEGEKEVSADSVSRIGKANGRYWASETKLEYEFTPNQYVQFELGPLVSTHVIKNVTDLENRNNLAMSGFFGEVRYLILERNASSPLAVTLSAEPEWHCIDETSGNRVTNLGLELKVTPTLSSSRIDSFSAVICFTRWKLQRTRITLVPAGKKSQSAAFPLPFRTVLSLRYSLVLRPGICAIMTAVFSTLSQATRSLLVQLSTRSLVPRRS